MSAFSGGAAAAAMLVLSCAPYANASQFETQCAHQRADRAGALDLAGKELDARLTDGGLRRAGSDSLSAPLETNADRVPSSPEFDAVMIRIREDSAPDRDDDNRGVPESPHVSPHVSSDASPIAEADVDGDVAERTLSEAEWASDSAHLPGLSDAAAQRYRRQMYRTDI